MLPVVPCRVTIIVTTTTRKRGFSLDKKKLQIRTTFLLKSTAHPRAKLKTSLTYANYTLVPCRYLLFLNKFISKWQNRKMYYLPNDRVHLEYQICFSKFNGRRLLKYFSILDWVINSCLANKYVFFKKDRDVYYTAKALLTIIFYRRTISLETSFL